MRKNLGGRDRGQTSSLDTGVTPYLDRAVLRWLRTGAFAAALALLLASAAEGAARGASELRVTAAASNQIYFYANLANEINSQSRPVVRPSVVFLRYDGSIVVKGLHWSSWGGSVARATGVYSASNCNPSCATGKRTNRVAKVSVSHPEVVVGHKVYGCFQLTVPNYPVVGGGRRSCIKHTNGGWLYEPVGKPATPPPAAKTDVRFYTPSGNIACEMIDNGTSRSRVGCIMQSPPAIARLAASGRVSICQHQGLRCTGNLGDDPSIPNGKLRYGSSKTVGRFRCKSAFTGVTCVVIKTGKGFFISKQSVRAVG